MSILTLIFLVVAIIAGMYAFGIIATTLVGFAKLACITFVLLCIASVIKDRSSS